ncbi:tetratricopeptide repeat protein, partial [Myxococcota bacterium]|nr:tetratricopeptide repeat protein [Myxococcota bacterium]
YYELIEVLKKRVEHFNAAGDGEKAIFYLDQMARIWEEKLETPGEAIKILEQILSANPSNVTALTGMARLYENMQDWEKCQQYLEKAALLEPQGREGAELAYRRGNIALKLNDEEVAQQRWEEALRLYAMHEEAFEALSKIVTAKGDKQTLVRLYQLKLPLVEDPEEKLPMLLTISDLFVDVGASEAAFPYLEEAVEIDPENTSVKRKLGDIHFAAGHNAKAMEIYTELADLLEDNRKMKHDLAIIYERMAGIKEVEGDLEAAIELSSKAQRMDPTYVTNVIKLAQLHVKAGELDKGQKLYRALLFQKLDGEITKGEIFLEVAKLDLAMGNQPKALASAKRGLSEEPSNEAIKAFIEENS